MAWFELLSTGIILGGVAFYCWAVYGRKSGPTGCIGCGKCVADGVCILTGKRCRGCRETEKAVMSPLTIRRKCL